MKELWVIVDSFREKGVFIEMSSYNNDNNELEHMVSCSYRDPFTGLFDEKTFWEATGADYEDVLWKGCVYCAELLNIIEE